MLLPWDIQSHHDVHAASMLKLAFRHHLEAVELGSESLKYAQNRLSQHIKLSRLNMKRHHKYAYLFANLLTGVLSLGLIPVVTHLATGQWALFKSKQERHVDALERDTKNLGPEDIRPKKT